MRSHSLVGWISEHTLPRCLRSVQTMVWYPCLAWCFLFSLGTAGGLSENIIKTVLTTYSEMPVRKIRRLCIKNPTDSYIIPNNK